MQPTHQADLQAQIEVAQVVFVTAASRLLDEADDVRRQRDELLRLIAEIQKQKGASDAK